MNRVALVLLVGFGVSSVANLWLWNKHFHPAQSSNLAGTETEKTKNEEINRSEDACSPVDTLSAPACVCEKPAVSPTPITTNQEKLSCEDLEYKWLENMAKNLQEGCEHPENIPKTIVYLNGEEEKEDRTQREYCSMLGYTYLHGIPGVRAKNTQKGIELIETHCVRECTLLAREYEKGDPQDSIPKDIPKALALYQRGCQNKNSGDCASISRLYRGAEGIPADPKKEAQFMITACQLSSFPPIPESEECPWAAKYLLEQAKRMNNE